MTDACLLEVKEALDSEGAVAFDNILKDAQEEATLRAGGDELKAQNMLPNILDEMIENLQLSSERTAKQLFYMQKQRNALSSGVSQFVSLGKNAVRAFNEVMESVYNSANISALEARKSFYGDLEANKLIPYVRDKKNHLNIAKEIAELNKVQGKRGITGDTQAQKAAEIYETYIQSARATMVRLGVPVANLEGRIVRQVFDAEFLARATKEDFVADMYTRVDRLRTFDGREDVSDAEVAKYLGDYYDGVVGGEIRDIPLNANMTERTKKTYVKKQSEHRLLHLKSAEDVLHSVEQYTGDSFIQTLDRTVFNTTYNAALIEGLGANPRSTFEAVREQAKALTKNSKEQLKLSGAGENTYRTSMRTFFTDTGTYDPDLQAATTATKNFTNAIFLGRAGISQIGDLGTAMTASARMGASPMAHFGALLDTVFNLKGLDPDVKKAVIAGAEVQTHFMAAGVTDISTGGSPIGTVTRASHAASEFTMRASLLQAGTNMSKRAAAFNYKTQLYSLGNKKLNELPKGMQFALARGGIFDQEWAVIAGNRELLKTDFMGKGFINVYKVDDLQDSAFSGLVRSGASKNEIAVARSEFKRKLLAAVGMFTDDSIITAGARERSIINMGSNPGTWSGMATQFMTSLLGYPISYSTRVIGRTMEADNPIGGFGMLAASALVFGTVSDYLWNLSRNRTRNYAGMINGEAPLDDFLASVIVRGGFGGIYASTAIDYIQYGQGAGSLVTGAPIGLLDMITGEARKMASGAIEGDFEKTAEGGIELLRKLAFPTNLPIVSTAVDYAIYYPLMEMAAPDKLARMQNNWSRRTGGGEVMDPFNHLFSN